MNGFLDAPMWSDDPSKRVLSLEIGKGQDVRSKASKSARESGKPPHAATPSQRSAEHRSRAMGGTASGDHAPDLQRMEDDVAAPFRAAWDFGALPIFPPEPPRGPVVPARVLQPKLEIGAVDDPLEREADAAADRVMRMVDPVTPDLRRAAARQA